MTKIPFVGLHAHSGLSLNDGFHGSPNRKRKNLAEGSSTTIMKKYYVMLLDTID